MLSSLVAPFVSSCFTFPASFTSLPIFPFPFLATPFFPLSFFFVPGEGGSHFPASSSDSVDGGDDVATKIQTIHVINRTIYLRSQLEASISDYSSFTYYSVEFIAVVFISKLISRPVRNNFVQRKVYPL
jgi:hypothetical protein